MLLAGRSAFARLGIAMLGRCLSTLAGFLAVCFGVVGAVLTARLRRTAIMATAMMSAAGRQEKQNEEQGQK